jgi:hypothetical protein
VDVLAFNRYRKYKLANLLFRFSGYGLQEAKGMVFAIAKKKPKPYFEASMNYCIPSLPARVGLKIFPLCLTVGLASRGLREPRPLTTQVRKLHDNAAQGNNETTRKLAERLRDITAKYPLTRQGIYYLTGLSLKHLSQPNDIGAT